MANSNEVAFQDAYVMRRKPFRETSTLAQFWVREIGLIDAVVKGVHGKSKTASLQNAWLQPFQCLSIQIRGRRSLKQVYKFEPVLPKVLLRGQLLFAGQYVNELIILSLSRYEAEACLFEAYHDLLQRFSSLSAAWPQFTEKAYKRILTIQLRDFEQKLLGSLGFAIDWFHDAQGRKIQKLSQYEFLPGVGFEENQKGMFTGSILLAIGYLAWEESGSLGAARHVLRLQIEWCAGRTLLVPSLQGSC